MMMADVIIAVNCSTYGEGQASALAGFVDMNNVALCGRPRARSAATGGGRQALHRRTGSVQTATRRSSPACVRSTDEPLRA
jgi:hypothetical protein